ncbi:hypothetical protein BAUCODRAFT_29990 [Baudoinia panamericana UAMH 10762]|uniref:Helicase C-terminal domain-containing protein n=1 Tax=Baudoinia panamericana (strain UAMH 10762) TaxID=717646 RepID=M2NJM8_BAUPA|nr:uncharacterized protein BAUCODRAFT_29990 [Baudoinia panamericana UAMH 10762]EMC99614.1 hypothetical protein BAUCODRAFT_29990 [Baudoinia panamericana UAMH 10762]
MQIVKREVVTVECQFDAAEQECYDRLQNRADTRLKEMMNSKGGADYIGALVLLLRLRQACDHFLLIERSPSKDEETAKAQKQSRAIMEKHNNVRDDMDDLTRLMEGVSVRTQHCDVCQIKLSAQEARDGAVRCAECEADLAMMKQGRKNTRTANMQKQPAVRRKRHQLPADSDDEEGEWIADGPERAINLGKAGGTDDEDAEGGGDTLGSIDSQRSMDDEEDDEDSPPRAHRRRPPIKSEFAKSDEFSDSDGTDDSDSASNAEENSAYAYGALSEEDAFTPRPSTKIRQLLRILHAEQSKHKTIVFSQFTTMLDLIQPHLKTSGIRCVRYDGSMRNDAREAALHSLRNDPKTRVLLCSLKCGSLGLNLTAASRVVIVEPFWNPFVEEQAIDRVHRLNQTVDVKVYRLTITNSVEERILALQERKRELAKAAIEGTGTSVNNLNMQEILGLFKHDAAVSGAEHDAEDREMWRKFGGDQRLFGNDSDGLTVARNDVGTAGSQKSPVLKAGRVRNLQEHDVFGRRW